MIPSSICTTRFYSGFTKSNYVRIAVIKMKNMQQNIWVTVLSVIFLHDVHSNPTDERENECKAAGGISWKEYETVPKIRGLREMLWKVTKMEDYYDAKHFGENADNFCSHYHFGKHCGPTKFIAIPPDQRIIEADALALSYNNKTDTICRIYRKMDASYRYSRDTTMVFGYVMRVDRIDKNNMVTDVEPIPEFVRTDLGDMTTVVAYDKNGYWTMFRSCNGKRVWVKLQIPEMKTLQQHIDWDRKLEEFKEEIEKKLTVLGIDENTLTTVPLDLPFSPSTVVMPKQFLSFEPIPTPVAV